MPNSAPNLANPLPGTLQHYRNVTAPNLKKQFKFSSLMQVPKIQKIVLNMGLGEAKNNRKILDEGLNALSLIAGQKAVPTKAKKSIAGFKIREDMLIGAKVTLRKNRMHHFLTRLIHVSLPRVRDFHGLPKNAFDGNGNYTLALKQANVFPELARSHNDLVKGISIVFVTSAQNNDVANALLHAVGLPIKK